MSEAPPSKPTPLGIYDKPNRDKITAIEIIAILLSVIWLIGAAVFFMSLPSSPMEDETFSGLRFLMTMLAIFMPVAMIWVAALAARATSVMRQESQRLQTAIDAIRQAYISQQQSHDLGAAPSVTKKLEEIAAATRNTETALATFSTSRDRSQTAAKAEQSQADDAQPRLELGTTAGEITPPLSKRDLLLALNFPETAEDETGFDALRRALKDRQASQLISAAQDILTLLSQDGIYMDDLRPDRARPEIWRQFATGTRGRAIASLGGVRDRSSTFEAKYMAQHP